MDAVSAAHQSVSQIVRNSFLSIGNTMITILLLTVRWTKAGGEDAVFWLESFLL